MGRTGDLKNNGAISKRWFQKVNLKITKLKIVRVVSKESMHKPRIGESSRHVLSTFNSILENNES